MSQQYTTPEVSWAQRSSASDPERNYIYLTIAAPDVPSSQLKIDLKPGQLTFTGPSETKKTTYHVELPFFDEIDVENSKTNATARDVEFVLRKKELREEFWPRLIKEKKRLHFLKTDFDKWVDEDEQDAAPEEDMSQFAGAGGMPGMGGMGADGGFGGIDFSKLGGGAGGMPDLGDADMGEDDEDENMPGLEDPEAAAAEEEAEEGKGKGKEPASTTEKGAGAKIEELL